MPRKLTKRAARKMAAARKTYGGGRPRVLRDCPGCGVSLSAREMLAHACRKTTMGESREAEIRHYCVPLNESFRIAAAAYHTISIDPNVMAGAPCIANTRIPVYMILDAIESDGCVEAATSSYPRLTMQQIRDAIGFAKLVVECPVEHEITTSSG